MKPLILMIILAASVAGQISTKEFRESLHGQTLVSLNWRFDPTELVEVDILNTQRRGDTTTVTAYIRTGNAPGSVSSDGSVSILEGEIAVSYTGGRVVSIQNLSVRTTKNSAQQSPSAPVYNVPLVVPPPVTPIGTLVFNRSVTAYAGKVNWASFVLASGGNVRGRLQGSGGDGLFECFIMTDRQLADYRNGKRVRAAWSSNGMVAVADIDAQLGRGVHYIVINNANGWVGRTVGGQLFFSY